MPHNLTPRAAPRRALERPLTKICAAMVTRISIINRRNRGGRTGRTTLEVAHHGGQYAGLCRTEMPLAIDKKNSVSGIELVLLLHRSMGNWTQIRPGVRRKGQPKCLSREGAGLVAVVEGVRQSRRRRSARDRPRRRKDGGPASE